MFCSMVIAEPTWSVHRSYGQTSSDACMFLIFQRKSSFRLASVISAPYLKHSAVSSGLQTHLGSMPAAMIARAGYWQGLRAALSFILSQRTQYMPS